MAEQTQREQTASSAMESAPFRQIRAIHTDATIRVYQAYNDAIADLVAGGPAVSIGRAPESGLVLDHVQVSSQHASVVLLANGMYALNILSASTYTAIRPAGGAEISYMVLAAENTATNVRFEPTLPLADEKDKETGQKEFVFVRGPLFTNLILADEINRTPPKTQAALLEAMQEKQVSVGKQTYKLEEPFMVMATQNPIEQEGTYPLPEAQKDRFMFHVKVDYPNKDEEEEIINRTTGSFTAQVRPVITGEEIIQCQQFVRKVPVPDHVKAYVLNLVRRCRPDDPEALPFTRELISWGPGPRACQQLIVGGKVRAILKGRPNVTPEDIAALAHPVLRHRIVPTFNAEAEGITVNHIIDKVLQSVPQQSAVA